MTDKERRLAELLADIVADARGFEQFPPEEKAKSKILWASLAAAEKLLLSEYPEVKDYTKRWDRARYKPVLDVCGFCGRTDCGFMRLYNLGKER